MRISRFGNPKARIVPISRVRELTAEYIVFAEANIAPMVRKTAMRTPIALRNRPVRDCFS